MEKILDFFFFFFFFFFNKQGNGLEINLKCVIITFNHGFSVFNVCCSPGEVDINARAATNVKHL